MSKPRTLMAVHAHPDDECSSTGGVLAKYSAEGVRTIVVTCTNGELGDAPGGIKPGQPGHDPDEVAAIRRSELATACDLLGVSRVELLGYHDSGMSDWEYKDRVDVFSSVPSEIAAGRLAELMEEHRPDVVISYCTDDGYDHPDHLQASRITLLAAEQTKIPQKVYLTAMRAGDVRRMLEVMKAAGIEAPELEEESAEWLADLERLESRITTTVDTSAQVEVKRAALMAHDSQIAESFFAKLPTEAFAMMFGHESFIRAVDTTGAAVPETDLFAGIV